jgi:hypothetical protein
LNRSKRKKKKTIERIIYEKNSSVVFFLLLLLLLIGVVFRPMFAPSIHIITCTIFSCLQLDSLDLKKQWYKMPYSDSLYASILYCNAWFFLKYILIEKILK